MGGQKLFVKVYALLRPVTTFKGFACLPGNENGNRPIASHMILVPVRVVVRPCDLLDRSGEIRIFIVCPYTLRLASPSSCIAV